MKLVGRVKRVQEEVAALKALCRDLLAQKQVRSIPNSTISSAFFSFFPKLLTDRSGGFRARRS